MRGLPMDFPEDPAVRDLSDQWMFGPALMPCPVYEYKARSRSVYFPKGGWYDFYTGAYIDSDARPFAENGGRAEVSAPYERMPLYVRAGSILPVGPEMEWSDEKPADDLLLIVYAGADADFILYEDDGLTYAYEKGACSTIGLHWNDAERTLTIDEREGSFPGMLQERSFRVVVVDAGHPFAFNPDAKGSVTLRYSGSALQTIF